MNRTERSTMTLTEFLQRELEKHKWTVTDLEVHTGVSRGALRNILAGDMQDPPKLETLQRIAQAFHIPLWRIVEMTGFESGVPTNTSNGQMARIIAVSRAIPQLSEILEYLPDLTESEIEGALAYLEALVRRRNRRPGSDGQ